MENKDQTMEIVIDRNSYRVIRSFVETYTFNIERIKQYYTTVKDDVVIYRKEGKWWLYSYSNPKDGVVMKLEDAAKLIQEGDKWFVEVGGVRIPIEETHKYAVMSPGVPHAYPIAVSRIVATMCKFENLPFCKDFNRYELCLELGGFVMCAER
ncbi:MAG: hypothetical protein ACP5I3_11495 [Thermoproteus sp.]